MLRAEVWEHMLQLEFDPQELEVVSSRKRGETGSCHLHPSRFIYQSIVYLILRYSGLHPEDTAVTYDLISLLTFFASISITRKYSNIRFLPAGDEKLNIPVFRRYNTAENFKRLPSNGRWRIRRGHRERGTLYQSIWTSATRHLGAQYILGSCSFDNVFRRASPVRVAIRPLFEIAVS